MRVLIFSTAYLPFVGGAELAIQEITDWLSFPSPLLRGGSEGGVSFTLITARFKRSLPAYERLRNVEVYRVGFGTFFDKWLLPFLGLALAKRLNADEPFDAVWSMMASQASVAAAWFKKAFPEKKLVLTLQEGDEEEHLKRYVFGINFLYRLLIRPWHTLVFKRADAITAISHYLADRARKNNPRVQVTVVPNGVDLKNFQFSIFNFQSNSNSQIHKELRRKLGFGDTDKIIITTSRLVEKNAAGDLIEAMQYLPENFKLIICGSGSLESDLKLLTSNLQLTNRVRFVGHIPHEQLPPYLWASDIFCRPSRSEGLGISFLEAMAVGLPVIATSVGGITDFLCAPLPGSEEEKYLSSNSRELANRWGEKMTGLFVRVGNAKDIAEKIQLLLSNEELRNRIIANGSKMVREKYDWSGIAQAMKRVFLGS